VTPPAGDDRRAARLAARLEPAPRPATRWEDRYTRWTIWIHRDLQAQVKAYAKDRGLSERQAVDELFEAGLAQQRPSTVHRGQAR
jgi:hypothetical protein